MESNWRWNVWYYGWSDTIDTWVGRRQYPGHAARLNTPVVLNGIEYKTVWWTLNPAVGTYNLGHVLERAEGDYVNFFTFQPKVGAFPWGLDVQGDHEM